MNKTNVITIEKYIPIPETRSSQATKYAFVEKMEIGDSFYINGNTPDFTTISVKAYMYKQNAITDRCYTVRTIEGTSDNAKAVRIWRTK